MEQEKAMNECRDCGAPVDTRIPFVWALYMGHVYPFCDDECKKHWLEDSQEGTDLLMITRRTDA